MTTKTCSSCQKEKPIEEFGIRKTGSRDGRMGRCDECRKKAVSEYYKNNNEKIRKYRRNYGRVFRYGITDDDVAEMISQQGGKCAICRKEINSSAHVDHDHESGRVRGILCKSCNIALGLFEDDLGILVSAFDYLEFYKSLDFEDEDN